MFRRRDGATRSRVDEGIALPNEAVTRAFEGSLLEIELGYDVYIFRTGNEDSRARYVLSKMRTPRYC